MSFLGARLKKHLVDGAALMTAARDLLPGLSLHSHNYSRTPTIFYFVGISGYYVTSGKNLTARAHTHVPLILDPCQDKFGFDI